jgi:hypothetical protein
MSQRVQHLEETFTRDGKDPVAALFDQAVDEQTSGSGRIG